MNTIAANVLHEVKKNGYGSQRRIADALGYSLGGTNQAVRDLVNQGYLKTDGSLTESAYKEFRCKAPENAIILAAGFGMRMVPINMETPKGLLEVHGEPLIERLIRQLHEVGIQEISIVVGFMKEQYEYLIDEYGVNLIVNSEYASRNNLYSLSLATKHLKNTYIIPCDIWCESNPFSREELYSWYMVSDRADGNSSVRVNRKMELAVVSETADGNAMIGICYLLKEDSQILRERIDAMVRDVRFDNAFWEEALYCKNKMNVAARVVSSAQVVEINTYEQLRDLDSGSNQLKSDAIEIAASALHTNTGCISNIEVLKKGMTNRSFLFEAKGQKYIMRIPGEGTDQLINRRQEAKVYDVLAGRKICDDVVYMNPENGYKITGFLEGARVCDPMNREDVHKCMKKLRAFHEQRLCVEHRFDIFGQIEFYESLWNGAPSAYRDYKKVKGAVFSLKPFLDTHKNEEVLTHIDAVPDNFLFVKKEDETEEIRLIDWEYAGMQDPHVDIAMFCIYSMYDREHIDQTITLYFPEGCSHEVRLKIYGYIAACGLLWSNWCEYKRSLGVDFGEYSLCQYRYAKEYYRIFQDEVKSEHV